MTVSRRLLEAILDGIDECFYATDPDWRISVFNRGAEKHFGLSRESAIGRSLWEVLRIGPDHEAWQRFHHVMETREPLIVEAESIIRPGRLIEGRMFSLPEGVGVAVRDVTDRRRAETELRRREAELAHVQRIAGVGGLEVDLRHGFSNRRSPEYLRLHGLPPESANESHEAWVERIHPEDRQRTEAEFRGAVDGDALRYASEYRIIRPDDGQVRWIAAAAEIERDRNGRAIRLVGAHRDVTDRVVAQERQRLLINELNHRVKNTLATVQSIASQSFRHARTTDEALAAFEERLMALSRAHNVLTRERWAGANLHEIVAGAAEPYQGPGGRLRTRGDNIRLSPQTALALAMALQELATNAVKYGALSTPSGWVEIEWAITSGEPDILHLTWLERGGPPVKPPERRGFGSRLIERSVAIDLNGAVSLAFDPEGVVCTLEARLPGATDGAVFSGDL
ncbi:sensor histidine kinase [Enterovirga sp. CN4-39]|uniref:sensor histidine kinase n=1 Tax=Enterovirga sp. CN4-39 TaxID=3400910 RepID=UPI003C0F3206